MGAVKKADIPDVANFMPEFWNLIKQFWVVERNNSYWEALIDAEDELYKKYPTPFTKHMLTAFAEYLEREEKKLR